MHRNIVDMTNVRTGHLVGVSPAGRGRDRVKLWNVRCDCGKELVVRGADMRSGKTLSCGCFGKETRRLGQIKHGESILGAVSTEYRIWQGMLRRCHNATNAAYFRYGGRGIIVCDRWRHDYQAFLLDMGRRPSNDLSLDRIDNDGNYEPGNCRWATAHEQRMNQRRMKKAA